VTTVNTATESDLLEVRALSPVALLKVGLEERTVVILTLLVTVAIVTIITLLQPITYTARAAFRPTISRIQVPDANPLEGLSGVTGGTPTVPAIDYFVDLIESRGVLKPVATALLGQLQPGKPADAATTEKAIVQLSDAITVSSDPRTGIVRLFVRTPSAALSRTVADHVVAGMDSLLERMRISQAESEQRFLDARHAELLAALNQSEAALQSFEERNRGNVTAASLMMEENRLQRDLGLRQNQFTQLERTRFTSRLDAVRSTPFIGMVEPSEVSGIPDSRRLGTNVAFAAVLGLLLGLYIAFARHGLMEARSRMLLGPEPS
jgi:uncharacterized protein involved in exopolysaccharide biosynthesis